MAALLLPFARRRSDGAMVSPDEVARGRACDCFCPGCELDVLARQGTEREWHFAHVMSSECTQGYEISTHELAKQLLRQRKELLLPSLDVHVQEIDAYGLVLEEFRQVFQTRKISLDAVQAGETLDGVNVDILGIRHARKVIVEITVFHQLQPDKRKRLIETGIPCFQINLERFKTRQVTKSLLEKALFEDTTIRHWIYHPKRSEVEEKLRKDLNTRLQANQARWDEEQASQKRQATTALQFRVNEPASSKCEASPIAVLAQSPLMLSASLPSLDQIESAARSLSVIVGVNVAVILECAATYTSRAQLQGIRPRFLIDAWSSRLNIPIEIIENFLVDAGYLIRCR